MFLVAYTLVEFYAASSHLFWKRDIYFRIWIDGNGVIFALFLCFL